MAPTSKNFGGNYVRLTEASAANTTLGVLTPTDVPHRLLFATMKYSDAPTQTGAFVELVSGVGAAYNTRLSTGVANVQGTLYLPNGELRVDATDAFLVQAPAGGAGITSHISVYIELL